MSIGKPRSSRGFSRPSRIHSVTLRKTSRRTESIRSFKIGKRTESGFYPEVGYYGKLPFAVPQIQGSSEIRLLHFRILFALFRKREEIPQFGVLFSDFPKESVQNIVSELREKEQRHQYRFESSSDTGFYDQIVSE